MDWLLSHLLTIIKFVGISTVAFNAVAVGFVIIHRWVRQEAPKAGEKIYSTEMGRMTIGDAEKIIISTMVDVR